METEERRRSRLIRKKSVRLSKNLPTPSPTVSESMVSEYSNSQSKKDTLSEIVTEEDKEENFGHIQQRSSLVEETANNNIYP